MLDMFLFILSDERLLVYLPWSDFLHAVYKTTFSLMFIAKFSYAGVVGLTPI